MTHEPTLSVGLPLVMDDPSGLQGREEALHGAYLSAVAFASAGSGLHHKICHVMGGMFDLPHAQTHPVVRGAARLLSARWRSRGRCGRHVRRAVRR
ncbi:iron-containing alcohol dehydrogenase [Kibdelosporangium aridum]|uniref:iron-containing alcohol dehydrogenase n=1 Tax=Kibdelosporangium aridum TaxID=2030 RepID=UPI001C8CAD49|nr:iron-containing alcohol dehydrogenase [Kibdelosporangium aridum]